MYNSFVLLRPCQDARILGGLHHSPSAELPLVEDYIAPSAELPLVIAKLEIAQLNRVKIHHTAFQLSKEYKHRNDLAVFICRISGIKTLEGLHHSLSTELPLVVAELLEMAQLDGAENYVNALVSPVTNMTEIPILKQKRTYRVPEQSGYHSFFKVTNVWMWIFSKFVAFLIDTNDDDANPSSAVNVWLPKIALAKQIARASEELCSTATSGKRDRVFASYMMYEKPCPKVQKVDHNVLYDPIDESFSGPSTSGGLSNASDLSSSEINFSVLSNTSINKDEQISSSSNETSERNNDETSLSKMKQKESYENDLVKSIDESSLGKEISLPVSKKKIDVSKQDNFWQGILKKFIGLLGHFQLNTRECAEFSQSEINQISQDFSDRVRWSPKLAPKYLQRYFESNCDPSKVVDIEDYAMFENLHTNIQYAIYHSTKRTKTEESLKFTTMYPLFNGVVDRSLVNDIWGEVQVLSSKEARNEDINPFIKSRMGRKVDMKGDLKYLHDDQRKTIIVYGWILADYCSFLSNKKSSALYEGVYCLLKELERKLFETEALIQELHLENMRGKCRRTTIKNSPDLNLKRTSN
ncbi:14551_t:CDS:10 [Funneliformis caledonium]|uniref:14551_t:CDS:1 n=1 Tax=Funneliformis caledonium TaxID=1117310 RepID=A0A9N9DZM8_9GLOM|nr:14551_t:CDS:10 [Funneliformis caledonium]